MSIPDIIHSFSFNADYDVPIDDEPGKSEKKGDQPLRIIKDLRLACLAISTLGLLAKTAMMVASNALAILRGTFWVVTTVCAVSFAVNSYLILSSTEETDKLKSAAKELAIQIRKSIGQRLQG